MNSSILRACVLAMTLATSAHAEIVTLRASGTIANVENSGGLLPVDVHVGDAYSLFYSFDAAVDTNPDAKRWISPLTSVTLQVGNFTLDIPFDPTVFDSGRFRIVDNSPFQFGLFDDFYDVRTTNTSGALTTLVGFDLGATNLNPQVVIGTDPLQAPNTAAADPFRNAFFYSLKPTGGDADSSDSFSGLIDSVTPVPLPAGLWLLGSGLLFARRLSRRGS